MTMTEPVKEQLSALLDGELPDGEMELLVKRLDRDPDLRLTLSRYSLIGAALRTDGQIPAARAVAARVSAALAQEPPLAAASSQGWSRWTQLVAGLAVAASVAVVAVMLAASPAPLPAAPAVAAVSIPGVAPLQPLVLAPPAAAPVALTSLPGGYTTPPAVGSAGQATDTQLARYVMAHADYATPLVRRSLVSSLVSTEETAVPVAVRIPE
ncbi:MAG: sigma-E factor negative regulatory protein [Gammaproteobacteria bacterium]|nr:sigma-E factor negative regulatory protein [Gammaproteobacteria bacterium]